MSGISWDPPFPIIWIALLSIALLAFLLYLELTRKLKFKTWRIISSVLMVIALSLIVSDPKIETTAKSNRVLLLTNGYDATQLDSLQRKNKELEVFAYKDIENPQFDSFDDEDIINNTERIGFILGDGLPRYLTDQFKQHNYLFLPGRLPIGIVELDYPRDFVVQRTGIIEGSVRTSEKLALKLLFNNQPVDSAEYERDGVHQFSLRFFPKVAGPANLKFITSNKSQLTSDTSSLYLYIKPERKISAAMISAFPSAEFRFLKNFLTEKGHSLIVRNQTSRDQYHFEFVNRAETSARSITSDFLNDIDVLIIDPAGFESLHAQEVATIKDAIRDGLGVVSLLGSVSSSRSFTDLFNVSFPVKPELDTVNFHLAGFGDFPLFVQKSQLGIGYSAVTSATDETTLSAYYFFGAGRVGLQRAVETYRLQLEGKSDAYALLWSALLDEVSRRENASNTITIESPFPWYRDEPIQVQIISATEKPTVLLDELEIPIIEHSVIDDLWSTTIWTEQGKWHTLRADSDKFEFGLSTEDEWRALRAGNQIKSMSTSLPSSSEEPGLEDKSFHSLKQAWFILFLLAAGFLWLSPKL